MGAQLEWEADIVVELELEHCVTAWDISGAKYGRFWYFTIGSLDRIKGRENGIESMNETEWCLATSNV